MSNSKRKNKVVPVLLFIGAALIVLDQVLRFGTIWQWDQVLHHENFALILISLALGMLLSQMTSSGGKS